MAGFKYMPRYSLRTLLILLTWSALLCSVAANRTLGLPFFLASSFLVLAVYLAYRLANVGSATLLLVAVAAFLAVVSSPTRNIHEPNRHSWKYEQLRAVALGLLRYEEHYRDFPAAQSLGALDRPLHGWRTRLLPFLDRTDLHNRVLWQASWDAPANGFLETSGMDLFGVWKKPPLDSIARRFSSAAKSTNITRVVAITGEGFIFDGARQIGLPEIVDGPSVTILLVEFADSDILWYEPRDLTWSEVERLYEKNGDLRFLSGGRGAFMASLADGHPEYFSIQMSLDDLHALLTVAGGEKIKNH